jgi:hypothetical protein
VSTDPKFGRYCDECGNLIKNAHKIYNGLEICGSCYPRLFCKAVCSICASPAVAHRRETAPIVCAKCMVLDRSCLRCEKPVKRAGLLIDGKAVCPSCVPYFKEEKCCGRCGKLTSRLSSMPSAGIVEKICQACRNRETHVTCSVCRKYRKAAEPLNKGASVCVLCVAHVGLKHDCPGCGRAVPGRGLSRCRPCLTKANVSAELSLTVALFEHGWAREAWRSFGLWLHNRRPDCTVTLKVLRSHQPFFERLDAGFTSSNEVTEQALVKVFGTQTLRKHLLATQFLRERLGVAVSAQSKALSAENDRIETILLEGKRKPWGPLITQYALFLEARKLAKRTVRMYLSTAAAFCATAKVGASPWVAGQLERYLTRNAGARNNLSTFVTYCQGEMKWDVEMPQKGVSVRPLVDPVQSVSKLRVLLDKAAATGSEKASLQTVSGILATALGLSQSTVRSLNADDFEIAASTMHVVIAGERISLPLELQPFALRLVGLRSA